MEDLTPAAVVAELDKYIVGQRDAKRALAVALRNRYRRSRLPEEMQREIIPKNILMIGPTGVGKTALARRVARIIDAPFVKVEATKFTEVGYVGRDVESIVHDLVEDAVTMVHERRLQEVQSNAERLATERIVNYLCEQAGIGSGTHRATKGGAQAGRAGQVVAAKAQIGAAMAMSEPSKEEVPNLSLRRASPKQGAISVRQRRQVAEMLQANLLEDVMIEIEVNYDPDFGDSVLEFPPGLSQEEVTATFNDFMRSYNQMGRRRARRVSVHEARRLLVREEAQKLVDYDQVIDEALDRAEQSGVVFIDELDKIAGSKVEIGADVSGEGVQRDLLPIVEGSTVMTRYGPVKTDHTLFIAAGSFHHARPADLIPELQGRFPLRVELRSLDQKDFERILVEPDNSLIKQYQALLSTEGVTLVFTPDGIAEIARSACQINERAENIGARRLHTVMEKILEEISFNAADHAGQEVIVDAQYVRKQIGALIGDEDLSRYIL